MPVAQIQVRMYILVKRQKFKVAVNSTNVIQYLSLEASLANQLLKGIIVQSLLFLLLIIS